MAKGSGGARIVPLLLLAAAAAGAGCRSGPPRIEIAGQEARISPAILGVCSIFLSIANRGDRDDALVDASLPGFLHPYSLSEKHFLVSCQPAPGASWGVYLADGFDNLVLVREEPGYALLEPVPLRKTRRPPAIADRVNLASREATVYLADVYRGGCERQWRYR